MPGNVAPGGCFETAEGPATQVVKGFERGGEFVIVFERFEVVLYDRSR
jgi:hypothetical protein